MFFKTSDIGSHSGRCNFLVIHLNEILARYDSICSISNDNVSSTIQFFIIAIRLIVFKLLTSIKLKILSLQNRNEIK